MTKRTTPRKMTAERVFPVRVRVPVPPRGLGQRLNEMHDWLRKVAPDGRHFVASDRGPPDAALVYFADVSVAHAFCDTFRCGRLETC
jgi:hypothetical protein